MFTDCITVLPQLESIPLETQAFRRLNELILTKAISEFNDSLAMGDSEKAEEILNCLSTLYPENAEFPLKLGHLMYKVRKYPKAESYYKLALEKGDEKFTSDIYFGLGQTYFQAERYSDSHLAFTLLINNDPNYKMIEIAYFKLASIMKHLKDYNNAAKFLIKCLKTETKNKNIIAEALCQLGSVYDLQGKSNLSLKFYKQAATLVKSFRTASCLAWGYLKIKPSISEAICKKYLTKTMPLYERCDISFIRALALMKMDKFSEACKILEEQISLYPMNIYYHQHLGIAYYKIEEHSKALEIFQNVMVISPFNKENLHNLSIAYRKLGLKNEAFQIICKIKMILNEEIEGLDPSIELNKIKNLDIKDLIIDITSFPLNIPKAVGIH